MGKYILFDNNDDYDFLLSDFDGAFYSPERKSKIVSWLNGAYVALKGTKRDDTIVCWYDFQAVILFWLSKLFSRRNIICLNILLKPKNTIKNKFVTFLYKSALKSDNFNATISSCEYGSLLNKKFGRVFHYSLLYDVYHAYYEVKMLDEVVEPKSVFCGGRNGRDWNFLFSLASLMPDVTFVVVMPSDVYNNCKGKMKENVKVFVDVPYEVFVRSIKRSQIVLMPLDTDAPAGLIVLFQTIANNKPFVISRTAATCTYMFNHNDIFLPNDVTQWKRKIYDIIDNYETYCEKIQDLKRCVEMECNEQKFKTKIQEMIDETINKSCRV